MSWADHARAAIAHVHAQLPADAPLEARRKAVDAAYPFGSRDHWPYKAWLKVRRQYLARYGQKPRGTTAHAGPLFDKTEV